MVPCLIDSSHLHHNRRIFIIFIPELAHIDIPAQPLRQQPAQRIHLRLTQQPRMYFAAMVQTRSTRTTVSRQQGACIQMQDFLQLVASTASAPREALA